MPVHTQTNVCIPDDDRLDAVPLPGLGYRLYVRAAAKIVYATFVLQYDFPRPIGAPDDYVTAEIRDDMGL